MLVRFAEKKDVRAYDLMLMRYNFVWTPQSISARADVCRLRGEHTVTESM